MKRLFAAILFAMLLFLFACAQAETLNLLQNGSFETMNASGEPDGWYPSAYRSQPGYSRIRITDEKAHSGQYSAVIENASSNDARYTYTVSVEPDTLYLLSGYVLVESMEDIGNGANFGIEGIYSFSDCLFDTEGEWQRLEWYGVTGEEQRQLTFGVRVGGYSAESVGKAYFDDIALERIDELPEDVIASLWYDSNAAQSAGVPADETENGQKSTWLFIVSGLLFILLFFWLRPFLENQSQKNHTLFFIILMLAALVVRVILAVSIAGYEVDINCFTAWSLRMANGGPAAFYAEDYFCDYPPGAMLLLWPIGLLLQSVGLQNVGVALLAVKLLPILCDLLGGWFLYRLTQKYVSRTCSLVLAVLYLFSPAALVNGAAWGQMDSVLSLLILTTAFFAIVREWRWAIPLFVVSALVKPQALLFAPLGGMWLIMCLLSEKEERSAQLKKVAAGTALTIASALIIVLPFSVHQKWNWLIELYRETLGSYAYATLNTANLYYLIGANWAGLAQQAPRWMMLAGVTVFGCAAALLHVKPLRQKILTGSDKIIAFAILFAAMAVAQLILWLMHASYAVYGYTMMAFVYLFAILCLIRHRKSSVLPFAMALALIGIYVFGIKVHERYLFPSLILLLVCYAMSRDRRVLLLYVGFSVTTFINTAIVLDNAVLFGASYGHLNTDTLTLNCLLCAANLILCVYGAWIGISGLRESKPLVFADDKPVADKAQSYRHILVQPMDHRLHLRLKDYVLMLSITVAYAVLTFSHLGSTTAPQTAWVSTAADEAVVLKLDEKTQFSVLYYAGVSYYDFSIQVSDDGENWSDPYPCQMREGLCYRWNYAVQSSTENDQTSYTSNAPANVLWLDGQYLRVNACHAGLNLWEVTARNQEGENLPLSLVEHIGGYPELLDEPGPAAHLIDEMNTCVGEPSWFNGTYFDEIYHARTGYEHLHGIAPYETTHPPLGKLMMSAGIALFGMTPFGWRFAGAMIGVLMLPALYLLGYQITRRRSIATLAMMAFALDLMHFTQTRIATIDSFPVFFILLSYWFMVRYMQTDVFSASEGEETRMMSLSYLKTLIPLLFSGICMGLSIASKWIGIYSAVGLAVLFFLTMYRQYRVSQVAWEMEAEGESHSELIRRRMEIAQRWAIHRILLTCLFCVGFFVLIPLVIYYLSYIPYLSPTGPVTLKRLIDAQIGMLNYHSTPGLGMDHPFQSPWWQWPFILKPMWFAQDAYEPAGYASTIVCMGNPWIFYIGAFAMAFALTACVGKYVRIRGGKLVLHCGNGDLTLVVLAIAFFAQYLPWVLVPRSMYIYHYFASVPFIILATTWVLDRLPEEKHLLRYGVFALYLLGSLLFFVMFFPYASGYLTSTQWLDAVKWFPRIYY